MRNVIKMISILVLAVVLAGCDTEPKFSNDYTDKPNAKLASAVNEARGEIIHKGTYATAITAKANRIDSDITSYGIVIRSQNRAPQLISMTCSAEQGVSAIAHTILTDAGKPVFEESTISIMKYRKGIMDIRETDENGKPVFSLANGDTDFAAALQKVKELDKDTPVAFTIETEQDDGYSYTVAWSPLMKAGDLADAIAKLPLKHCANQPLGAGDPEVVLGYTNEQIRGFAQQNQ